MNKTLWIVGGVVLAAIVGVSVLWAFAGKSHTQQAEMASSTPVGETYLKGNLLLGRDGSGTLGYLLGFSGHAVYTYDKDGGGASACTGDCATAWPPYLINQADIASLANLQSGVTGAVGTLARADGGLQVTYDGKPLYFYAADSDTSGPKGDGVGGVWHLVHLSAESGSTAAGGTAGAHCGGFIQNAPMCATGFHCQLAVNHPDTGGICVADTAQESTTATINERIHTSGVYITPLAIVTDSRCPVDVQCIQAGTVTITAKLEAGASVETATLTIGKPVAIAGKSVTLMTVAPAKHSKTTLAPSDYRFSFSVVAAQ